MSGEKRGTIRDNLRWMQEQVARLERQVEELGAAVAAERAKVKLEREGAAKLLEFVSQTRIPAEGPIGPPIRDLLEGTARAIRAGIHVLPSNRWPLPAAREREPSGIAETIEAMMKRRER